MPINEEKQNIINHEGNVLVTANPGTGKTLLLAHKYVDLLQKGTPAEQILCLTFTEKAKREMENRILKVLREQDQHIDLTNLNVYTFHSYALENIEDREVLSSNLLRFSILEYLKNNEVINYSEDMLIRAIVPKVESLIRYLKSFGIKPEDIDINEVKALLEPASYTKEEIDRFAEHFLNMYLRYEEVKNQQGIDYNDMLIKFHELHEPPKFDYVLVDELQDVNVLEADIALKSGRNFVCVGDKKQAIFGFQGGSILNFTKFNDSTPFVLTENFRSTDQVLKFARSYFVQHTEDEGHVSDVENLHSADNLQGPKPIIYDVGKKNANALACEIADELEGKTAIITRTNLQIARVSAELKARDMEHAATFSDSSDEAKMHIIHFLRGVFSSEPLDIKYAMFTPFFPIPIQDAFNIAQERLELHDLLERVPVFRDLRQSVANVEDVNILFEEKILPVAISYGKDYLLSALSMQEGFTEALSVLTDRNLDNFTSFLKIVELMAQETSPEKDLIVSSVHKAKGREFENVIYLPTRTSRNVNYADAVVTAILQTKGISAEEELQEETLRVNFVAFTRAEKNLFVLTDKIQDYLNDDAELGEREATEATEEHAIESRRRAFDLFVNGQYDEARALIEARQNWIKEFVQNHFSNLEHTSFSALPEKPSTYFERQVLKMSVFSRATSLGSLVHDNIQASLEGREFEDTDETRPFMENVNQLMQEIRARYPEDYGVEKKIKVPLRDLGFDSDLIFKGYIDAVFKKYDKYLIVDWKTDQNDNYSYKAKQQLEIYRRAFSARDGIPLENIKVAIAYVGLRSTINMGVVECRLDDNQPAPSAFNTVSKRINKLLEWIGNVEKFFEDYEAENCDDLIWRSVVEEYGR